MRTMTKMRLAALAATLSLATPLTAQAPAGHAGGTGIPQMFEVAGPCMACHNGMVSEAGEDISFGTDWRSSMMANASRDPYWQAAVRRETMEHPTVAGAIQDECSKCHMPMARFRAHTMGRELEMFGRLPWEGAPGHLAALAADGVSCTMCHQIQDEGLGQEETFTGGFHVDTVTPIGERSVFGPYEIPAGASRAMLSSGLFQPQQSRHVQESALCATCHTLYTHARGGEGEVVGELPEQVPYLEWLHSDYVDRQSCQSCHMREVDGKAEISSVLAEPRENVSQHVFRGGNFFMPRIFNMFREELAVEALPGELDAMAARTRENLRTRTGRLELSDARLEDGQLTFRVSVRNLTGHKFPTAYPSRRAWLHVVVSDPAGRTLFESGALRPDGSIVGNDNDGDAARFEPHYTVIDDPEQVQIYEAIMTDPAGRVTTGLLSAVEYVKDNRVLPTGFEKGTADPDIAVQGAAARDADFTGGTDHVEYRLPVDASTGPLTVRAELWYQPIAFRWAQNLAGFEAVETERFVRYYDALSHVSGALVAEVTSTIGTDR